MPDEPTRGRHRRPANLPARIAWVVATVVLWAVAFAGGWTFQATAAASDGEPKEVVVATWMRDNHMGWAVAQLENLYYRYVVPPQVGGAPGISADIAIEDLAGLSASPTPQANVPTARPAAVPSSGPTAAEPTPSAEATGARPHLLPPAPIPAPVPTPEPKEGIWQPVGSRIDGEPAIYVTRVRADTVHTAYYASVMWIDTLLTKAMFIPGYEEPAGGPNPFNGALPEEFWPIVMANFNWAFRLEDSMGGYYYDGEMVAPLVNGKGTTVVYRDGSIKVGKWGRDLAMNSDVMAVRQNLTGHVP